jgi:hypothetical protein
VTEFRRVLSDLFYDSSQSFVPPAPPKPWKLSVLFKGVCPSMQF